MIQALLTMATSRKVEAIAAILIGNMVTAETTVTEGELRMTREGGRAAAMIMGWAAG